MRILRTDALPEMDEHTTQLVYCALDSMMTIEIRDALLSRMDSSALATYDFERKNLGPILDMMGRGFRINMAEREAILIDLHAKVAKLSAILTTAVNWVWDKPDFNYRSNVQLQEFFYNQLLIPKQPSVKKGQVKYSLDRDALERLCRTHPRAMPYAKILLRLRDEQKIIEALSTSLRDGRWFCSYNIGGTDCVSGDTYIRTRSGLRRMDSIYVTPRALKIYDGKAYYRPARRVKYDNAAGKELTLQHGFGLKCSNNHPVLTPRGFVAASELTLADTVAVRVGDVDHHGSFHVPKFVPPERSAHSPSASIPKVVTQDLAEWWGMILADGTLVVDPKRKFRIRLANRDKKIQQRFIDLTQSLFGLTASVSHGEIGVASSDLAYWVRSCGFPLQVGHGAASIKRIPDWLMSSKHSHIRALLKGLSLDSHYASGDLVYGTQSLEMQSQIQQLLLSLGVVATKVSCGNSRKLMIAKPQVPRALAMIGSHRGVVVTSVASDLAQGCESWHEPYPFGSTVYLPITSIREWRGDVYDVTMPLEADPQYVGNGMVVHNTGRLSSSDHPLRIGANIQNIDDYLRRVFQADENKVLWSCDQQGAEARAVAYLSGDPNYIEALEAGDVHTIVASMVFGFEPTKELAERKYYRDMSYRDIAKRCSHGTNYLGTPRTIAKVLKVDLDLVEDFQRKYFKAFPRIKGWQEWVAREIQLKGFLTTPFGRRRQFWSRAWEDTTVRAAIAYVPQSTVSDLTLTGMHKLWTDAPDVELLANGHDAAIFQADVGSEHRKDFFLKTLETPLQVADYSGNVRQMVVPWEASLGYNWGKFHPTENRQGLLIYDKHMSTAR